MKQFLFTIALLSGLILSNLDYLTKDTLDTGRYVIRNKYGDRKGFVEKDTLDPNRWNVRDNMGTRKGYFKRDPVFPDRWKFRKGE